MKYDVFICYSRKDIEIARFCLELLKNMNVSTFEDLTRISEGEDFLDIISQNIVNCKIFLSIISENALKSLYTVKELRYAKMLGKTIIPIVVEGTNLEAKYVLEFGHINYIVWNPENISLCKDLLIKAIKYHLGKCCLDNETLASPGSSHRESKTPFILKVLAAPIDIIAAPISIAASGIATAVSARKKRKRLTKQNIISYRPTYNTFDEDLTYSSIFAPAKVKPKSHMFVQVYLHLYEETEKVKTLAQESDKDAERRDYIPLQCKLKKGDKVDVLLNIYGETLLMSDKKSVIWQGSFTKCSFEYFVPKDIDVDELSCVVLLTVNEIPVGEMRFITKIVEQPRQLNPEIIAHKYNRVFVSYSHQDESKVKFLHEGLAMGGVPHFFDRSYLKPGDIFPTVIQDYINSADLFVLCWSENAAQSEYVKKERMQALERAYPKVQDGKLRIYPMSIEPRAELPSDMKDYYHFGEV